MTTARLKVEEQFGTKELPVESPLMTLGRGRECHLRLNGPDISRDHAEIVTEGDHFVLRDHPSKYGTFVNGTQITEQRLAHGDTIRLGRGNDCQLVFLLDGTTTITDSRATSAAGDLRMVATLLRGLRAVGSGRLLDEVLAMVLDSAIEVTGAERGFIMLAPADGALEFKMGRGRDRITLPGRTFDTSRKIPEEVFASGKTRIVSDLQAQELAQVHEGTVVMGIRQVVCAPLVLVRYVEQVEAETEPDSIGVLYLDSRERGARLSQVTRDALETLAGHAAVAIENARLYREAVLNAQREQELALAAKIQRSLMPPGEHSCACFDIAGTSDPCREIGGDFFDYFEIADGRLGVAVGDVSGKGAPAALLAAAVQGMFTVEAADPAGPAGTLGQINRGLKRRNIESKFVTLFYGVLSQDGRLTYCNGGHNPPVLIRRDGAVRLEAGGMLLGMFDFASYDQEALTLEPGDSLVVFSDGISEAQNPEEEEYGDDRLIACLEANRGATAARMREALLASTRAFAAGAKQKDDMTVLVIRYDGP